jgi:hypothetical protein
MRPGQVILYAALALPLALAGCSDWSEALSAGAGDYNVRLKTTPWPPKVGDEAAVAVRINDGQDRTVRACHVTFRQYMPEHEMHTDDIVVLMEELRSGVYSGKSPEYSMGGGWRIEVTFDCGTGIRQAEFDFSLDWPE